MEDLQARALSNRPDLQAAQRSVTAAESQAGLAKANSKVDLNVTFDYTHLNQSNLGAFYFNIGELVRRVAEQRAGGPVVRQGVPRKGHAVARYYFSFEDGADSLLDFLDAESTYRSTRLSYRQALASYMTAPEQLRQAVGARELE